MTVRDGIARLDDGTLASSTVTMNKSLKLSTEFAIPLKNAVQMATNTPANVIGLKNVGKIEEGYIADLVLLDNDFNVLSTWVSGILH